MRTVLVLSPHLDDAVLSAGQFLAGRPDVVVATVFTGTPAANAVTTAYDAKCGFSSADEAMTARRAEDINAMALLGATEKHLGFLDSQYGVSADVLAIAFDLYELVQKTEPEFVVGPLGLIHPDHVLVRTALLEAVQELDLPVWLYEDLPSRVTAPESVGEALRKLDTWGYNLELGFIGSGPEAHKMSALWCYRSQMLLPEFENQHVLLVPERFWKLTPKEVV